MKSTTYNITEITTQKAEKYLSEGRKLESTCLLTCMLHRQLRNFPCEFTEKCFAVFDKSSRVIYLMWANAITWKFILISLSNIQKSSKFFDSEQMTVIYFYTFLRNLESLQDPYIDNLVNFYHNLLFLW